MSPISEGTLPRSLLNLMSMIVRLVQELKLAGSKPEKGIVAQVEGMEVVQTTEACWNVPAEFIGAQVKSPQG